MPRRGGRRSGADGGGIARSPAGDRPHLGPRRHRGSARCAFWAVLSWEMMRFPDCPRQSCDDCASRIAPGNPAMTALLGLPPGNPAMLVSRETLRVGAVPCMGAQCSTYWSLVAVTQDAKRLVPRRDVAFAWRC